MQQGNQIRLPSQESPKWMNKTLTDSSGFAGEPLRFWLDKGNHTIEFSVFQNTLAINQLKLISPEELPAYETVSSEYESKHYQDAKQTKRLEAEKASAKSDRSIVISSDKTSPVTVPYSGSKIVYNALVATVGRPLANG